MSLLTYTTFLSEFLCFYFVIHFFLQKPLFPRKEDIIFSLSIILVLSLIPKDFDNMYLWLTGQILYLIYTLYLAKFHLLNTCILFIATTGILILCQIIVAILFSLAHISIHGVYSSIIGNFTTLFIILILFQMSFMKTLYSRIIKAAFVYRLILLNTFLVLTFILIIWKSLPDNLFVTISYSILTLLFLISINIAILYYDKLTAQQQKELTSYENSLLLYKDLITEIRANQHEYSNRLQTLQNLPLLYHDYDSICNALAAQAEHYQKPMHIYPLLHLNLPLLVAALYHQFCVAEKQDITIHFDVTTPYINTTVPQQDLADYLCILLQNAIEASQPGDHVYVNITHAESATIFDIRNGVKKCYSQNELQQFFQKGYTTKAILSSDDTTHGLGLYYLLKHAPKQQIHIETNCIAGTELYWLSFCLTVPDTP